jgi:hypothetical protein
MITRSKLSTKPARTTRLFFRVKYTTSRTKTVTKISHCTSALRREVWKKVSRISVLEIENLMTITWSYFRRGKWTTLTAVNLDLKTWITEEEI